jgi:predicted transcriptional regulator
VTKDAVLTVRLDRKLSNKLEKRARQANRSKSALTAYALESFFEIEDQEVAKIKRALARSKAGAPTIAHEDVVRWVKSWGTPNELPRPKATVKL